MAFSLKLRSSLKYFKISASLRPRHRKYPKNIQNSPETLFNDPCSTISLTITCLFILWRHLSTAYCVDDLANESKNVISCGKMTIRGASGCLFSTALGHSQWKYRIFFAHWFLRTDLLPKFRDWTLILQGHFPACKSTLKYSLIIF